MTHKGTRVTIDDCVVVITGPSSGIGRAAALAFAQRGRASRRQRDRL